MVLSLKGFYNHAHKNKVILFLKIEKKIIYMDLSLREGHGFYIK
jgi:hypothetical protein